MLQGSSYTKTENKKHAVAASHRNLAFLLYKLIKHQKRSSLYQDRGFNIKAAMFKIGGMNFCARNTHSAIHKENSSNRFRNTTSRKFIIIENI